MHFERRFSMNKFVRSFFLLGMVAVAVIMLSAASLENQGRAWLDKQKDPAQFNVTGMWQSEFGVLDLMQPKDGRDVTGKGGGYELTGVVSGKTLYILFATKHGTVDYCGEATVTADNNLSGEYQNRLSRLRFGAGEGVCQTHGRTLHLTKK
jgi:hypothetical protein